MLIVLERNIRLDGKTPGKMCGIEIGGGNKWKTIIENAKNSTDS
jgi:hypothetical protein